MLLQYISILGHPMDFFSYHQTAMAFHRWLLPSSNSIVNKFKLQYLCSREAEINQIFPQNLPYEGLTIYVFQANCFKSLVAMTSKYQKLWGMEHFTQQSALTFNWFVCHDKRFLLTSNWQRSSVTKTFFYPKSYCPFPEAICIYKIIKHSSCHTKVIILWRSAINHQFCDSRFFTHHPPAFFSSLKTSK